MAQTQESKSSENMESCDAYFERIQSRKKLDRSLQESLTAAFAQIPVSSFPQVHGGKVIEILSDTSITDAVKILSESNILSAPVVNPAAKNSKDWRERYLGIVDYSAIVLWVLQNAEIAAAALSATSAAAAGIGTGAAGALGALALGSTGPLAVAGLTAAAVGAAVAGGMAAEKGMGKDAPTAADKLGEDFYKVMIHEEPFKSATVSSILKSYRWAPFVPVATNSSMLSVLLLLSKYRLRNVPVIEMGSPYMKNFITQSAVIQGLQGCKGRDWFDCIAAHPISELGLPFMSPDKLSNAMLRIVHNSAAKNFISTIASATNDTGKIVTPITCKPDSTLGTVIDTLASKAVYRIYVVNGEDNEVVGVITIRDVISCFITEPPNFFDDYFGFSAQEILNQ